MKTTQLVAAGVEHACVLVALHRQCFEECWSVNAMAGALDVPGAFGFIACRVADPAGFVLCQSVGGESEVLGLGVTPAHRRRGVGRKLLSAALAQAKAYGAARMILEVAIDNGAARRLYASAGFVAVGQRRNYYTRAHGPRTDAFILACDLTRPSGLADPQTMD
jgi:[ribosomal protein S18]-alanine N-acetyltransferase